MFVLINQSLSPLHQTNVYIYVYRYLKKTGIAAHNMHDTMKNIFAIRVDSEGNISILYKIGKI